MDYEVIKKFAIDVLGCGCDDSVFNRIEQSRSVRLPSGITLSSRILIGDRLLIYIVDRESISPSDIKSVVRDGLEERSFCGYNRLRVVVATGNVEEDTPRFTKIFNDMQEIDEKTHIHVLSRSEAI